MQRVGWRKKHFKRFPVYIIHNSIEIKHSLTMSAETGTIITSAKFPGQMTMIGVARVLANRRRRVGSETVTAPRLLLAFSFRAGPSHLALSRWKSPLRRPVPLQPAAAAVSRTLQSSSRPEHPSRRHETHAL